MRRRAARDAGGRAALRLHEALRKELEDIMRRAEAEIAAQAPDRQRARRKTRARGEGDEPARGPNAIAARLTDLKVRPRPHCTKSSNYFQCDALVPVPRRLYVCVGQSAPLLSNRPPARRRGLRVAAWRGR